MCYPYTVSFLLRTPLLLYYYHSPGTPKAPVIPDLILSPIHLFRSPRMHSLYPFPTLSRSLSMSFQNLSLSSPSPSLRPYNYTIFSPWKLELIQRILKLTHSKSTTALCHTLFNRIATPSLALSISWTPEILPFTPHYDTFPFPFNFTSIKASNSNFPSLKTPTTPLLFSVPFIPFTFHVPKQFA